MWSGNELMGSTGVFCNLIPYCCEVWPNKSWDEVHGARADITSHSSGILRAIRALAAIKSRPSSGFISLVLGKNAPMHFLPTALNHLNPFYSEEALKGALFWAILQQDPGTEKSSHSFCLRGSSFLGIRFVVSL